MKTEVTSAKFNVETNFVGCQGQMLLSTLCDLAMLSTETRVPTTVLEESSTRSSLLLYTVCNLSVLATVTAGIV